MSKRVEPAAWTHQTDHGRVVSKSKLTYESVPLYDAEAIRQAVEEVCDDLHDAKPYPTMHTVKRALLARFGMEAP